jgi:hypothetical protein
MGFAGWLDWLQGNRVELNEMSTPDFIAWLDAKMQMHGADKIVPPTAVIEDRVNAEIEQQLRRQITDRILRDAKIDDQLRAAIEDLDPIDAEEYGLRAWFEENQGKLWTDWVDEVVAAHIAGASDVPS